MSGNPEKLFNKSKDAAEKIVIFAQKEGINPGEVMGATPLLLASMLAAQGVDVFEAREFMDMLKSTVLDMMLQQEERQ